MFQVKIGMRNMPMPGARRPKIVVIRLIAPKNARDPDESQPDDPQVQPDTG